MKNGTQAWNNRVDNNLPHHGLGASTDLSANVQHLVSPIVGKLRFAIKHEENIDQEYLSYAIDRLSFLLELAREEHENNHKGA